MRKQAGITDEEDESTGASRQPLLLLVAASAVGSLAPHLGGHSFTPPQTRKSVKTQRRRCCSRART
eukprot:5872783-Pleurochrysis_carterae.AAC.1